MLSQGRCICDTFSRYRQVFARIYLGAFSFIRFTCPESGICSLPLICPHALMAPDRDGQFLSRFHQEEASFSRT
ncbi:MAG: hypothetical protein DSZ23_00395 [Thermodesulfatator sp.]|nr:MAG: hypothetical protein DSZ23_00395 [Thermodesulfatator sp.]